MKFNRKLVLSLSLGILVLTGLALPAVAVEQTETKGKWQLVWSDEFDGDALDTSKWNYEMNCWGGGNNERQCYTDDTKNVSLQDGKLKITAIKKKTKGFAWPKSWREGNGPISGKRKLEKVKRPFSSGRITTKNKGDWTYGRFEARMKLPIGQGVWPAFWMLPTDNVFGGWASSGEIDIMEAINLGQTCKECEGGREDRVYGTLHFGGSPPDNRQASHSVHLDAPVAYHVYALEWSEGKMSWYVDGKLFSTLTDKDWHTTSLSPVPGPFAPFDQRFHVILNLAAGGKWPEENNDVGYFANDFPKELSVDYVRVYQCAADPDTGKACQ